MSNCRTDCRTSAVQPPSCGSPSMWRTWRGTTAARRSGGV